MATLVARITDLSTRIGNQFRDAVMPRLLPSGGTTGQFLRKSSGTNYAAGWNSPTAAEIVNTPFLTLASTDVQGAINELLTEKAVMGANFDITSLGGLTTPLSVAQGGTGDAGAAWTAYTPTYVASAGAITTATPTGRYKKIGRTVFVEMTLSIANNGTGAGLIQMSLPFTAAAAPFNISGIEMNNTGKLLSGLIASNGTIVSIRTYDVAYPGITGGLIVMSGVYESAA